MDIASFNALIALYRVTRRTANLLTILADGSLYGEAGKDVRELAPMWTEIADVIAKHLERNQGTLEH